MDGDLIVSLLFLAAVYGAGFAFIYLVWRWMRISREALFVAGVLYWSIVFLKPLS